MLTPTNQREEDATSHQVASSIHAEALLHQPSQPILSSELVTPPDQSALSTELIMRPEPTAQPGEKQGMSNPPAPHIEEEDFLGWEKECRGALSLRVW